LRAALFYTGPVAAARENRSNQNYWRVTRVHLFFGARDELDAPEYFDKIIRVIKYVKCNSIVHLCLLKSKDTNIYIT